jgi:hypothetical protein
MIPSVASSTLRLVCRRRNAAVLSASPSWIRTTTKTFSASTLTTLDDEIPNYDRIPEDLRELVDEYCHKKQTPVTMQALVKAGRKEAVVRKNSENGTFKGTLSLNQQNASGKILIQVRA